MIESRKCKLEFLPPYSPDFNPIEYSFSVIKKALKGSHQLQGNEKMEDLEEKLRQVLKDKITPQLARNQFHHCKIRK
jgi:transposase